MISRSNPMPPQEICAAVNPMPAQDIRSYSNQMPAQEGRNYALLSQDETASWALLIVAKRGLDGGISTQIVTGYSTKEEAERAAGCINDAGEGGSVKAIVFPGPARR